MKNNNVFRVLYASLLAFSLTVATSGFGQVTNWVVINDHHRGTTSSPYANFYNPALDDAGLSGPLTNTVDYTVLAKGAQTPASIIITTNGASNSDNPIKAPSPGTPAGDWFRACVDFVGNTNRDTIQLRGTSTITYTFNGLDSSKRYIFKGTTTRGGDSSYANRWTQITIDSADSFNHAHKPSWAEASTSPNYGVLTSSDVTTLAANQAAWCSGVNTNGAMIVLTNINPGSDGSFSITVQTYKGTVPGGSSSGSYAYAFSAFSLEEIDISVPPSGTTENWVAINDHRQGSASSPYANFYNPLGDGAGLSGKLTNTVDYTVLPKGMETTALIVITTNGASNADNPISAPNPGTPAGDWFRAYVDFGTGNRDAIQLRDTSSITYTFNGLDTSKRYTFKGTAARGASYADRWTVATIDSANSFIHSHKPTWAEASTSPNYGVLTANEVGTTNLAVNQAAFNSGENRAAGAMIVFSDIDPGPDGSFSITVQTYRGLVPGGSSSGTYGYGFSAFSLQEANVIPGPPIIISQPPATITINECQTLTLTVVASGGTSYQWYHQTSAINPSVNPTATNLTLVITNISYYDSGNYYLVITNQYGEVSSSLANVTVIQDTTPPTITAALGLLLATNLPAQQPYTMTDILITFSEPVSADSATLTGNYQVYTMNNPGNQLTIYSAQLVSPSNVLLRTSPRVYLQNYTLKVNNVSDCSPSRHNLIAADSTFNIWHELGLFTFADDDIFGTLTNNWKYDASGTDNGPYWYTNSADFYANWMDGWQLFVGKRAEVPTYLPEVDRTDILITNSDGTAIRTFYFWRTFNFPDVADTKAAELHLRFIVDDGAIFYLNKHEIYAVRMPTSRPIYYTNWATGGPTGDAVYEPPLNSNAVIQPYYIVQNDYLQKGVNEMAVEVHQVNETSTDTYFGAVLTAVVPPFGVAVKPWFTVGPTPTNTTTATAASFSLTADVLGTEPIYYTWYFVQTNSEVWTLIPGQTTATLTINNLTTNNSGTYYLVVSNSGGAVTSSPAFLTVLPAPIITSQPVSVSTNTGVTVVFTVGATGITPLSYQWYWNDMPISGATSSTLTLNNVLAYQSGSYYVVVTNVGGVVTSQVATLTLPPDTVKPYITMALGLLRATNAPPTQPPSLTDILITFSEPVDPTTATNPANYRVDRYSGGQNLAVIKATVVNLTNVVIVTATPRTLYENYTITVNGVTDFSPQRNPIIANTKYDIYLELPLIYFGATNDVTYAWKCDYSGNTNNAGLFYQVGFDDSTWGNCWMLFEWKNTTPPALPEPIGTLVPIASSSSTNFTYYFRKHFDFPAAANTKSAELRLRFVIDDGAIFYMNGSEVYAIRMPTARPMTWETQATSSVGDARYEPVINASAVVQPYYVITNGYLLNGDNLMAVEVHQNGTASSDLTFGMILTAVVPPIGVTIQPPQIVTQPQSVYTNYGTIVEFSVEATGVAPLYYQWYFDNAPISGANSSILAMTNVTAQHSGNYFVVVTNDGGAVTSQVATLTFIPDTVPPTLVMAVGLLKATNYPPTQMPTYRDILLTFSENMDVALLQNAANYAVSRQGGNALQISNVVVVNLTNVLLTTVEAREPFANYIVSVSNVKDASAQHNSIVATNFVIYQEVPLVYVADTNHTWKYDMSMTDFGINWLQVDFDDSGWSSGVQLFEAKRGTPAAIIEPIMTRLPDPINSESQFVRTYYFRTHFTVPEGVDVTNAQLYLRYIIDDGAVFYLNGSEIHAYNMPATRPVTINDSALTTLGDPTNYMPVADATAVVQPAYLLTFSNVVLKTGDNLMAVEVHQPSGTGSTDAAFAMNLTAVIPPTSAVTPPPTVIISQTFVVNDKIRINFTSQSGWTYTLESAAGLESQNLIWGAVTSVEGDGSVKVLEDTVNGGRKFYRLRAVKN